MGLCANYGITVALSVITFLIASVIFEAGLLQFFASIVVTLLVLTPLNLRLSRIIWIHMFVTFERE